jgi:ribosomal-protein-serine acetyltransferase
VTNRLPDVVRGDGMVLRIWRPTDAEVLARAVTANVEHLRPWMAWVAHEPLTLDQRAALLKEWNAEWEDGKVAPMAMLVGDQVGGGTGYVRPEGTEAWQIGYWVDRHHLGHGYATTAARLLTSAALELEWISQIEIHHDKANQRSGRVPARLGYAFIGERPDAIVAPGEVGIDCTWRMTKEEWENDEH